MLFLTENEVRGLLPMREAVRVMRETFEAMGKGTAQNHPRHRMMVPTGAVLHSLAGWWGGYFGTKIYATHVKHGANFLFWLCEAATAKPLALMEANYLGQIRTGAASGYATDLMARQDAKTLGVIGSGFQAWTQVEAVLTVRPNIQQVFVFSRSVEKRTQFAAQIAADLGVRAEAVDAADQAVRDADILITATFAKDPVVESSWVRPGTHINAVGSNQAQRRELPSDLVHRAKWIAVDSLEQARLEAGDLLLAGDLAQMPIVELQNWNATRAPEDVTLFKSIGLGVEDVAVAAFVYEQVMATPERTVDYQLRATR